MKKIIYILIGIALLGILVFWFVKETSKPEPGQLMPDQGRGHVPLSQKVNYNSNPPTSGPHDENWVRLGVYPEVQQDQLLVHSLEHGYVIISYNCEYKTAWIKTAFAHGMEEEATESAAASTPSAQLSDEFRSDTCHALVDELIGVFEKKGKKKIIVVPRPNLDAKIALTAWRRLDKFNSFDSLRLEKFIDAYRDKGPEKTDD